MTGGFRDTISFGTHSLTSTGLLNDIFIAKLTEPSNGISTFPATWDFENPTFPPDGWTSVDADGGGSNWQMTTEFNHTPDGSQAALHPYSSEAPEGQTGWLITPAISVPSGLNMVLDFWYFNQYSNGNKYCALKVNTVNDPYDPNWVQLWRPALAYEEWRQQAVNISAYGGQTVYFAFHYQGDDADNWIVDDVTIHQPEGADTQGPVITFLPPLNSPRYDLPLKLTATVTDDPVYNNALGGVKLHWKIWGAEEFNELPMTLESGNNYFAWIPAPGFYTEIDYYFEAWDVLDNYSNTENYSWFYVENPCWLSYDWGGTLHEAFNHAFGVANVYPNPYFDRDMPVQVLQTGCGANVEATATLCVYAYDGTVMTPLMEPQQVALSGSDWITYTDLSAQELLAETPYFIVAYTDIPAQTGIWHDRRLDYGASFTFDGATLTAKQVPGSWVLPVQITNGALAAPELTIARVAGYPKLTWNAVPDAQSYHIYYSINPYAADPWNLLDSTGELNYTYTGTNPIYFFKVTADSAGPEKASHSSGYLHGSRVYSVPDASRNKPKPGKFMK